MNRPLTIQQLLNECMIQVARGNGDKYIYTADDDEGNGYHGLYFSFTDAKEILDYVDIPLYGLNEKDIIILG